MKIHAQTPAWYAYYGNNAVSKKLNWQNEVQYRSHNLGSNFNELILRTGLGYDINDKNNILMGYGVMWSHPYENGAKEEELEHRIYQQFITSHTLPTVKLQHRVRLEERFLEEDDFKMRFRYQLSASIPITNPDKKKYALYASAYNEIFMNFTSKVFNQNRLYAGLGMAFNKDLRAEAAYMLRKMPQEPLQGHVLISLYNDLPFKKK